LEHSFIDFRANPLDNEKVKYFASKVDINILFNNKGTKYRDLKLKELNLDDEGKLEWLCKENMLLKRPVVEYDNDLLVGFDENIYKEKLL
ncbi:MAG: ArsC/Spx/MgsR family protein, partial [Campylobacterota bacterium]|nr:ArsC/Spx/MgsR family protein [Campylobacterota bacterium]